MIPRDIAYAFHCSRCGGLTQPGKDLCPFCSQEVNEYFNASANSVRVIVNGIYLNGIYNVGELDYSPKEIDTTSLLITNGWKTYVHGIKHADPIFTIESRFDRHFREQADFFNLKQDAEVKVEIMGFDSAFEFRAKPSIGAATIESNMVGTVSIDFKVNEVSGWKDFIRPDLICPNCGALINFAFGCCSYCGGWVEWRRT